MSYYTKIKEKKKIEFSWKKFLIKFAITLGIIFIASLAIIIPKMSNRLNPEHLQARFMLEYNDLKQAYKAMQKKGFDVILVKVDNNFAKKFAGYFKLESTCDDYSDACLFNNLTYKTLDGKIIPLYYGAPNVGQFRTRSGALYMLYWYGDSLWVFIDINGIAQKPNRFGLDLFAFLINENDRQLRMMGSKGTPFIDMDLYCNPLISNKFNGLSCPFKAVMDQDYFEKTIKDLH